MRFDFRAFRNALVRSAEFNTRQVAAIENAVQFGIEGGTGSCAVTQIQAGDVYVSSGGVRLVAWDAAHCTWHLVCLRQFKKEDGFTSGPPSGVMIKRTWRSMGALRDYLDDKGYKLVGSNVDQWFFQVRY